MREVWREVRREVWREVRRGGGCWAEEEGLAGGCMRGPEGGPLLWLRHCRPRPNLVSVRSWNEAVLYVDLLGSEGRPGCYIHTVPVCYVNDVGKAIEQL